MCTSEWNYSLKSKQRRSYAHTAKSQLSHININTYNNRYTVPSETNVSVKQNSHRTTCVFHSNFENDCGILMSLWK